MSGLTAALVAPVNGLQRGLPDRTTGDRVLSTGGRVSVDTSPPARLVLAVTSEGLAGTGSPAWHTAGFTGTGVKVAILDVGFDGLDDVPAGDLPAGVLEVAFDSDGVIDRLTDHGTQMAEIVHDIAPDAELVAMTFADEKFAEAVAWLESTGDRKSTRLNSSHT